MSGGHDGDRPGQVTGGTGVQRLIVGEGEDDMRLDRWFKVHFPDLKHGRLEKLLRTGQIRVAGGRVKASTRIEAGQEIRVPPMPAAEGEGAQQQHKADKPGGLRNAKDYAEARTALEEMTLYQDDAVLILNKPPGLAVQGGSGQSRHLDGMLAALERKGEVPRLVHRLDKDTSGVMVLGRSMAAARALAAAFRARDSFKLYWALTSGVPNPLEGDIKAALSKAGGPGHEKMTVDDEGKRAVTRYAVIDSAGKRAAWVALRPVTGRTHQLRVHLQMLGTPIIGDGKYGGPENRVNGLSGKLHLHAQRLILPHPVRGMIDIEAPPPAHFIAGLDALGFVLSEGGQGFERLVEADSE